MATNTWDETAPNGATVAANTLDTVIKTFKLDIRERFAVNHEMSADDSGLTKLGAHSVVDLVARTSPSNEANIFKLFAKDASAKAELHWKDEDGNERQFTSGGHYNITDAVNIILGTTTGTKLGTGATQKLGFWNATPVVQPGHIADASTTHAITDPGDSPADADALRDDLVTNTIPTIESALNALGTVVNLILADLAEIGLQASA